MKKQRNKKRLTFEDRMLIQACLLKKMNITEIAVFCFAVMVATPILFFFVAKPIPLRAILQQTLFYGPLLLNKVTPINLISWITQGVVFLALAIVLFYLPRKEKSSE